MAPPAVGGWLGREMIRDIYLASSINLATVILGRTIRACLDDDVPKLRSFGLAVCKWWTEISNHHCTSASNGPTEA